MSIHHGQMIEKVIRRNGHSITDIARLTNVNRRSVYNWFSSSILKPEIILNIGAVIDYDFSKDLPNLGNDSNAKIPDAEEQNWKLKYIDLLEKYNALLQRCFDRA